MVMELVSSIVEGINNCLWGLPMIGPLFGTHLFLTFRTGFIQRRTFTGIRLSVTGPRIPLIGDQEVLPLLTTKQEGEHALHQPCSPSCLFSSPGLLFFTVLMVLTVLRNTAQYHYRGMMMIIAAKIPPIPFPIISRAIPTCSIFIRFLLCC